MGERVGPRLRELASRGRRKLQEEEFTQPRAHSFAQPCTLKASRESENGKIGSMMMPVHLKAPQIREETLHRIPTLSPPSL